MPRVSVCAKFAIQISNDEALMMLLTVGLLFISMHLSRVHLATARWGGVGVVGGGGCIVKGNTG